MSLSSKDVEFVIDFIYRRSSIVLDESKRYLIESRLTSLARTEGYGSLADLIDGLRIQSHGSLADNVTEAMTTNETSFYRDLHPFEGLKSTLLPQFLESRKTERTLRVWSAACSSGQEAYTVGMLIREYFPQMNNWTIEIFATDINEQMCERTRQGNFNTLEVNRGLPAPMLIKYFRKTSGRWQVRDELRKLVRVQRLNLAEAWPALPKFDVVFLRNVLIYFDVETKRQILGRMKRALRPDGCLFLGAAETTLNLDDGYEWFDAGRARCYRIKTPAGMKSKAA